MWTSADDNVSKFVALLEKKIVENARRIADGMTVINSENGMPKAFEILDNLSISNDPILRYCYCYRIV